MDLWSSVAAGGLGRRESKLGGEDRSQGGRANLLGERDIPRLQSPQRGRPESFRRRGWRVVTVEPKFDRVTRDLLTLHSFGLAASILSRPPRAVTMPGSYPGSELSVEQLVHALVQAVDLTSPASRWAHSYTVLCRQPDSHRFSDDSSSQDCKRSDLWVS